MNDSEFNALLKLLSDPDEFVSESAKKKLIDEFEHIEDKFSEIIADSDNNLVIEKANEIFREHYFLNAKEELASWKNNKNNDLIRGLYIITKIFRNDLDYQQIFNFFENIKRKIFFDLQNCSPLEQIRAINAIIFKELNIKVSYKEQNFNTLFLDYFISHKQTSPFLITAIYYIIAQKLNLPVFWLRSQEINLLTYSPYVKEHPNQKYPYDTKNHFYFFINPADKGYIFTYEEFKYSLNNPENRRLKSFVISSTPDILKIFISNLMLAARKNNLLNIMDYLVVLHRILN